MVAPTSATPAILPFIPAAKARHELILQGIDMTGNTTDGPMLLQMNDDDFPKRFFQDLLTEQTPKISSVKPVALGTDPLYQPVQRMLNAAMIEVACNSVAFPRLDPTRVVSAGVVVRRVVRRTGNPNYNDLCSQAAWMRNPAGQFNWVTLGASTEDQDPDPAQRPQLASGQAEVDAALAAMALSVALTESSSPAFVAPPATCATLGRTVVYGVVPTASSEVADAEQPKVAPIADADLAKTLPGPLRSHSTTGPRFPLPGTMIDYRWLSDDFLSTMYFPTMPATPAAGSQVTGPKVNPALKPFQDFVTSLRMLHSVFGAFDTANSPIVQILNRHLVTMADGSTQQMGAFYALAKTQLMDFDPTTKPAPSLTMPMTWDWLNDGDHTDLLAAIKKAVVPRAQTLLAPQGRFQDPLRLYRLRMFLRVKGETPNCPAQLVWSDYTDPFRIAAWYETGDRTHPPVLLPDPSLDTVRKAKPNCSFQVPGSVMGAMQGASLSGLMSGAGGGAPLKLGWICGFNIPLITICAFFVLSIFLSLLNIIFFWLPFIKICIPFPVPASTGDEPAP